MTAAFLLGKNVDLTDKLGVRLDGAGFSKDLTSFDVGLLDTSEQAADVVAGLGKVKQLANISMPVMTVLVGWSLKPTISTSSDIFTTPLSTLPVATVPRPVMENTSSTGIRKGMSDFCREVEYTRQQHP